MSEESRQVTWGNNDAPIDEGDAVLLRAKVYRANEEQALIEFTSMEGYFSARVPLSELTRVIPPEVTAP